MQQASRRTSRTIAALALSSEPELHHAKPKRSTQSRCRTNSRRGATDPAQRSYPPVQAVCRALGVLRAVNKLRIASVHAIHAETGFPKPTIVRILETLAVEGYVARDNMCGGYCVTSRVHELTSGHQGISQIIEAARPFAVDLTRRLKWPIGIGAIDGDAIAIKFWTGAISPWAHTNTVLGLRPNLVTTAMGRAHLAFCSDDERERHFRRLRADPLREFGEADELRLRAILQQVRHRRLRDARSENPALSHHDARDADPRRRDRPRADQHQLLHDRARQMRDRREGRRAAAGDDADDRGGGGRDARRRAGAQRSGAALELAF